MALQHERSLSLTLFTLRRPPPLHRLVSLPKRLCQQLLGGRVSQLLRDEPCVRIALRLWLSAPSLGSRGRRGRPQTSAVEGNIMKISRLQEALDTLLEGTSYSLFESTKDDKNLVSPVWWAFLIAVLFFLLAEAILCLQPKLTGPPSLSTSKTSPAS